MIDAIIDGQKMSFASEAGLIAYQTGSGAKKSESCGRVRALRKREAALRFHFGMILRGKNMWHRIQEIHDKAPELTERVALEMGVTELKLEKCNGGRI